MEEKLIKYMISLFKGMIIDQIDINWQESLLERLDDFERNLKEKSAESPRNEEINTNYIAYTGTLVLCSCGSPGKLRFPYIKQEDNPKMYISCDECFSKTWAGEN